MRYLISGLLATGLLLSGCSNYRFIRAVDNANHWCYTDQPACVSASPAAFDFPLK